MPEAFFQEEAVDLGIEFIQEVEAMELPAGELAVVEDLLDCIFDEAADRDAKLLGAIECLKIAKILESDRCTAFLARIAHDALHHFDRRAVLTVAYAHVGPHRILDRLWVMDRDVSLGAVVSLESLKGVVLGSDDAVATVVAELGGKGEDFAAHLYNVSAKRRLKALLKVWGVRGGWLLYFKNIHTHLHLKYQKNPSDDSQHNRHFPPSHSFTESVRLLCRRLCVCRGCCGQACDGQGATPRTGACGLVCHGTTLPLRNPTPSPSPLSPLTGKEELTRKRTSRVDSDGAASLMLWCMNREVVRGRRRAEAQKGVGNMAKENN